MPVVFHSGHAGKQALSERYPMMRVCPKPSASSAIAQAVAELCRDRVG